MDFSVAQMPAPCASITALLPAGGLNIFTLSVPGTAELTYAADVVYLIKCAFFPYLLTYFMC